MGVRVSGLGSRTTTEGAAMRFNAFQRDKDGRWFIMDLFLGDVVYEAPTDATNNEESADRLASMFERNAA